MSPPFRQSYAALNAQPHEAELIERLKAEAAREFAKYPERDRPDLIRAYVRGDNYDGRLSGDYDGR